MQESISFEKIKSKNKKNLLSGRDRNYAFQTIKKANKKMIIVALDEIDLNKATAILENLDPKKCMIKIGSVSFNCLGHQIIHYVAEKGFDIFLDLKLNDIPNTIKSAIKSYAPHLIDGLTFFEPYHDDLTNLISSETKKLILLIFIVFPIQSLSSQAAIPSM